MLHVSMDGKLNNINRSGTEPCLSERIRYSVSIKLLTHLIRMRFRWIEGLGYLKSGLEALRLMAQAKLVSFGFV